MKSSTYVVSMIALMLVASTAHAGKPGGSGGAAGGGGGGGGGSTGPMWEMTVIDDAGFGSTAAHQDFSSDGSFLGITYSSGTESEYFFSVNGGPIQYLNDYLSPADAAAYYLHNSDSEMNNLGQFAVSGQLRDANGNPTGGLRAFRVSLPMSGQQYATVELLDMAVGPNMGLYSINNLGEAVGREFSPSLAYYLDPFGAISFLALGSGHTGSSSRKILDDGSIYGYVSVSNGSRATMWSSPSAQPTVLPYIALGAQNQVVGDVANSNGTYAVGTSSAGKSGSTTVVSAAKWNLSNNTVQNLGNFGGSAGATSINADGDVVGYSFRKNNVCCTIFYADNSTAAVDLKSKITNMPSGADFKSTGNPIILDNDDIMVHVTLSGGIVRPALLHRVQ